jgi:hypothetical protein
LLRVMSWRVAPPRRTPPRNVSFALFQYCRGGLQPAIYLYSFFNLRFSAENRVQRYVK